MLFQSVSFVIFLLIVFCLYWSLPHRMRWCLLLAAGYFYYSKFGFWYAVLLLAITLFSYGVGRILSLERWSQGQKVRRILLVFAIAVELLILVYFKIPRDSLILPVGISFYTFQTLAYMIDVYRDKNKVEKHLGYYVVSVAFFPILLAGPIERIPRLAGQLKEKKIFSEEKAFAGIRLMLLGYFKKMVIADSLAVYVDSVYNSLAEYAGFSLILVIVLYSVEIYCDFSGYSDIAIGVARLFGIELSENFRMPYFADSIKEFWKRWHISLTSWFRDYVYIPLGGNRVKKLYVYRNLLIVFLLSGIWHGTGLTFLVWGGIHGVLQILESVCSRKLRVNIVLKRIFVFILVSIAWVFFRADSITAALYVLSHSLDGVLSPLQYLRAGYLALNMNFTQCALLGMLIFSLFVGEYVVESRRKLLNVFTAGGWAQVGMLILAVEIALFYLSKYGTDSSAFIYFQF